MSCNHVAVEMGVGAEILFVIQQYTDRHEKVRNIQIELIPMVKQPPGV